MNRIKALVLLLSVSILISGCLGGSGQQDLVDFIAEEKRRPKKQLKPIPAFETYQPYSYSANSLRNPFEQPIAELDSIWVSSGKQVSPDLDRNKEFLEEYSFEGMSLVGFVEMNGNLKALIDIGQNGRVFPVQSGNYLGKNHGRIMNVDHDRVDIVEIISDGLGGWVERPGVLLLSEKD